MKVDELISILQRVRAAKGNVEVQCNSFCGTNQGHVSFDINPERKNFNVADHMNDFGTFCLSIEISDYTRKEIEKGVADMKRLGYRFYLSQFVGENECAKTGLSPCEWHNPW
jgi:hypothetical protein